MATTYRNSLSLLWSMLNLQQLAPGTKRPVRGPRNAAPTRPLIPPTICTMPLPAKSTYPRAPSHLHLGCHTTTIEQTHSVKCGRQLPCEDNSSFKFDHVVSTHPPPQVLQHSDHGMSDTKTTRTVRSTSRTWRKPKKCPCFHVPVNDHRVNEAGDDSREQCVGEELCSLSKRTRHDGGGLMPKKIKHRCKYPSGMERIVC